MSIRSVFLESFNPGSLVRNQTNYSETIGSQFIDPEYEQKQINQVIVDTELREKELKILEEQLKLPPHNRNIALMMKYKVNNDYGLIEDYEDSSLELSKRINEGFIYKYDCYFPFDESIKIEERPVKFLIHLKHKSTVEPFDEFTYIFPVRRNPNNLYEYIIDNLEVIIDIEGNPIDEFGDSVYHQIYRNELTNPYIKGYNVSVVKKKFKVKNDKSFSSDTPFINDEDFIAKAVTEEMNKKMNDESLDLIEKLFDIKKDDIPNYDELSQKELKLFSKVASVNKPKVILHLIFKITDNSIKYIEINKSIQKYSLSQLIKDVKTVNFNMLTTGTSEIPPNLAKLMAIAKNVKK